MSDPQGPPRPDDPTGPETPPPPAWGPPTQPTPPQPPSWQPPSGPPPPPAQPSPPAAPEWGPPGGQPPPYGGGPAGAYTPGPPPGGKGSRRGLVIGLVVAVALVAAIAGVALALSGGGDGGGDGGGEVVADGGTEGLVTDRQGVERATVRIVAQGSFVDPEVGEVVNAAGSGSGFVIDPEGIVVTNNHVVTGAATVEVFVGGEPDGRNAQILATSECSDLAVLDLEGDGYDYLEIADEEVGTGVDVYAAGFPEGDPEYTLTRGIISKANASGETNWASVDSVIEHDATINPGNSGGPLVTEDGRVVGVNYAGDSEANQYFAITQPTLTDVVAELREERPVDYLGINGQAVLSEEGGLSGVWVSAVESGSPAAELGLEGGDVLTKLEGLNLATDGTLADYCDILRTQGTDAELSAQVLRFETDEYLDGAFNAGEELEVDVALSEELQGQTSVAAGGEAYEEYEYASDDSGVISVEVPVAWSGRNGEPLTNEGGTFPRVIATPDLAGFSGNFSTSGTVVLRLPGDELPAEDATLTGLLEGIGATAACPEASGREDYSDAIYSGRYELLTGCDGTDAAFAGVVAAPEDQSFTVFVGVQLATAADFDALDRILASFVVNE